MGCRVPFRLVMAWLALLAACAAMPAAARSRITPYIEVQQVLDVPLSGSDGGDVLTYTTLAAGVDGTVRTRRMAATFSYRYERRVAGSHDAGALDAHDGLARVRLDVAPDVLSLEAGAIATRARADIRGEAPPTILIGNQRNISQVYGIYAGPTLASRLGAFDVGATYRFGYVKADDRSGAVLAPGQPRLDSYDSATSQNATASIGMRPGLLPFGWTVSAGYDREDARQLDQRYEGKYARADLLLPVSPTLALTGGVGYEHIRATQRDPLRDAGGNPVLDGGGRFVTDPASPRRLAYDTDGLIYDGGVVWKPNRRVTLEARGGYRYGGVTYTGSLTYRISPHSGLQAGVYDRIDSFGRSLLRDVAALPTSFALSNSSFADNPGGCVAGTAPGTGGCFDDAFQSISTANFRSRGVFALYSASRGPWNASLGGGYAWRRYLAPADGAFFSLDGVEDRSIMIQGTLDRRLTRVSGIGTIVYANWYKSGIAGARNVTSLGGSASYYRTFGERLIANASIGIYGYDRDGMESVASGTALVGMRYQF